MIILQNSNKRKSSEDVNKSARRDRDESFDGIFRRTFRVVMGMKMMPGLAQKLRVERIGKDSGKKSFARVKNSRSEKKSNGSRSFRIFQRHLELTALSTSTLLVVQGRRGQGGRGARQPRRLVVITFRRSSSTGSNRVLGKFFPHRCDLTSHSALLRTFTRIGI